MTGPLIDASGNTLSKVTTDGDRSPKGGWVVVVGGTLRFSPGVEVFDAPTQCPTDSIAPLPRPIVPFNRGQAKDKRLSVYLGSIVTVHRCNRPSTVAWTATGQLRCICVLEVSKEDEVS